MRRRLRLWLACLMSVSLLTAYGPPVWAATTSSGTTTGASAPAGTSGSGQSQSNVATPPASTPKNLNTSQGSEDQGLPKRLQPDQKPLPSTVAHGGTKVALYAFRPVTLSAMGQQTCTSSSSVSQSVYGTVYGAAYGTAPCALPGLPFPVTTTAALQGLSPQGLTATVPDDGSQVVLSWPSGGQLAFAPEGTSVVSSVYGSVYAAAYPGSGGFALSGLWAGVTLSGKLVPRGYKETLQVARWTGQSGWSL